MNDKTFFRLASQPCPHPVGTRVRITGVMPEDPNPLPIGTEGTVTGGSGAQLFVDWDEPGRGLMLLTDDPYVVLPGIAT
ncbi:MAG: DUF4314 domain-containing protein [Pseudonocardiaceae bacterium]